MRSLAVAVVAACTQTQPMTPGLTRRATLDEFRAVDHLLDELRPQMCRELDRDPPSPPPVPIAQAIPTDAEIARDCDAGDAAACFNAGVHYWVSDTVNNDHSFAPDIPWQPQLIEPEHARPLYRRSCDRGYDNGCLWLNGLLRDHDHDHLGRVALVRQLVATERDALAALLWSDLKTDERQRFAPSLAPFRDRLEQACSRGSSTACDARAQLECDVTGQCAPGDYPWRAKACRLGSAMGCQLGLDALDAAAIDETKGIAQDACSGGTCTHLVADLAAACARGGWASCYVAANACVHGAMVVPAYTQSGS